MDSHTHNPHHLILDSVIDPKGYGRAFILDSHTIRHHLIRTQWPKPWEPLFWDVPKHWEVSNLIRNKAVAKKSKRHFTSLAF